MSVRRHVSPSGSTSHRFAPLFYQRRDFLLRSEADRVLAAILNHEDDFRQVRGETDVDTRNFFAFGTVDSPLAPELGRRLQAVLPGVLERFGIDVAVDPEITGYTLAYNDGSVFRAHRDDYGSFNHTRRLSFTYHLHRQPRGFQGGALLLHGRTRWKRRVATAIEPESNSIVFFASDTLHEVTPVKCASKAFADSRFTVVGWVSQGTARSTDAGSHDE